MSKKKKKLPIRLNVLSPRIIDGEKVISFSQYSTFSQCPHKWYLQSVKKIKQPPNINTTFGSAMHYTLQHYLDVMYKTSGAAADREDLEKIFEDHLTGEYKKQVIENNNSHFSNPTEFSEFFDDGVAIIEWFKKHRSELFSTRGSFLVGIEMLIEKEIKPGILFKGFIDLVIYDADLDKIIIYDFKTSTKGWSKWQKDDFNKSMQIILYKLYFSELYNYPINKIDVEFLILKRKVAPTEWSQFPKRVQSFKPTHGKVTINKAIKNLDEFIETCFSEGKPIEKEYLKKPSKLCDWCLFNNTENCIK
jgi:hypothetical protein